MKNNKFLASTLTAAMVATAIAPVASAASFTDINHVGDQVKAEIERAVELGYFKDSTQFNPVASINRSQAALTLARHIVGSSNLEDLVSYVEEEELEDKITAFDDIGLSFKNGEDYQKELYYASLIVKNAGAFTQATLNPSGKVTRSQMAKIITGAFGLEKVDGFQSVITDIAHLDAETKGYIDTISSHEVTNVTTFNPAGTVTRSQMASFLVRAYDATAEEEDVEDEEEVEEIQSVQPINTTVDLGGTLKFAVNEEEEAANLQALVDAGYTVEFQSSKNVFVDGDAVADDKKGITSTTGKIDKEKISTGTVFEYSVIIKKDGEVVAEMEERQSVKVENYSETAVSVDEVIIEKTDSTWTQEIKSGQLGLGDKVQLSVKGKVKSDDKLVDFSVEGTDPTATVEIDRPAVLAFDQSTGQLIAHNKGTATVTVTVGDQTKSVTYKVGDQRELTTAALDKKSLNLAANQKETVSILLTDQYGLRYTDDQIKVVNNDPNNKVIKDSITGVADLTEAGKYTFELTAVDHVAEGTALVKIGDLVLGTITIDVKKAKEEIKSYKLLAEDTVFDLKTDDNTTTKELSFKGYDEQGIEVPEDKQPVLGEGYKLASTDTDVVTVTETGEIKLAPTAEAGDKVFIEAFKVAGAFEDKVAQIEFTVVDSSPQIDTITITETEAVVTDLTVDFAELATVTASNPAGTVAVAYEKYEAMENNFKLRIVEADEDGKPVAGAKTLGMVEFSPSVEIEKIEDGKVTFKESVKGETITATYVVDREFKGQIKLHFNDEE